MTMFIIQSLLLIAIAYVLGCVGGCLLHRLFDSSATTAPKTAPVAAAETAKTTKPKPAPKSTTKARSKPAKSRARVVTATPGKKDDLKRIKGIGRQNEARLKAIGVTTYGQIAEWSAKDQQDMGERLSFPGRIEREEWVKQAKTLEKGGQTDFSKRVAKGDVSTSIGKGASGSSGAKPQTLSKPRSGGGDELTLIDGVGGALEKKLNALGIHHFDQIAKWSKDNQSWIGNELGFPGRPERENWVRDAKAFARGGTAKKAKKAKKAERGEIIIRRKTKK